MRTKRLGSTCSRNVGGIRRRQASACASGSRADSRSTERDRVVGDGDKTVIGNGDAVGVPREVALLIGQGIGGPAPKLADRIGSTEWPYLVCATSLNPPARQTTSLLICEIFHCPPVCTSSECMTPPAIKKFSGLFALVLLPCHMCIATRLARTVAMLPCIEISCPVNRCCDPSKRAKLVSWLVLISLGPISDAPSGRVALASAVKIEAKYCASKCFSSSARK